MIPAESIDVIQMSWQPEAADYAEAFAARNRMRHVSWLVGAMCVLGALLAVLAFIGGQPGIAVFGLVLALFFAVMGRVGSSFLYQRNAQLQQPVSVVVDARAGVAGNIPVVTMGSGPMRVAGGTQFGWAQLETVLETKRVFVLHLAGQQRKAFFLLAKRGLADPAQEAALRRVLTR